MGYAKDTAILVIKTGEDGYVTDYFIWNENPPPIQSNLRALDQTTPGPSTREMRISSDKNALKTELNAFVDSFFDVA